MAQFKGAPNLFGNKNEKPEVKITEPVKEEKKQEKKAEPVKKPEVKEAVKKQEKKPEPVVTTLPEPVAEPKKKNPEPEKHEYVSRLIKRDTSGTGRPRKEGEYKLVSLRLSIENYEEAIIEGAKFGGMTAFIGYLIDEYRKNNEK